MFIVIIVFFFCLCFQTYLFVLALLSERPMGWTQLGPCGHYRRGLGASILCVARGKPFKMFLATGMDKSISRFLSTRPTTVIRTFFFVVRHLLAHRTAPPNYVVTLYRDGLPMVLHMLGCIAHRRPRVRCVYYALRVTREPSMFCPRFSCERSSP